MCPRGQGRPRGLHLCNLYLRGSFFASYAFVVITLPDSPMASHREKFSLSAASVLLLAAPVP